MAVEAPAPRTDQPSALTSILGIECATNTVTQDTLRVPHATPRRAKVSSLNYNHKKKGQYTKIVNQEMQKAYAQVGVEDFFSLCMPPPPSKSLVEAIAPSVLDTIGDFKDLITRGEESKMYGPLCETIHTFLQKTKTAGIKPRCDIAIKETADRKEDKASEVNLKPDLSLFDNSIKEAVESFNSSTKDVKVDDNTAKANEGTRESFVGETSWAWILAFIEIKSKADWLPFHSDEDTGDFSAGISCGSTRKDVADVHVTVPQLKDTPRGQQSRSQLIKYVSEIQLRQHRNFVLCAHICQNRVRFMRWDRTGAIVSKDVNYVKFPRVLLEFLYRLVFSDSSGHGYDTSARRVPSYIADRDLRALRNATVGTWEHPYIVDMVLDSKGFPIHEIVCPGINAAGLDEPLTLWVGRYWSGSRSPTGRGSKAYIALDVKRSRLVFLKDYWCARHPTVHPELEIYERFRKAEKPPSYVAHCLGGGPVLTDGREQVTLTQSLLERIWISSVPVERCHYRFVLQEVGRPLETFKNSEQLIDLIYQAFLAHKQAWLSANVLHRDISPGNILINHDGTALLVDWDLSKYREDLDKPASQHGRSGTWPFMSAALLINPRKPNDLADDLEAFVYVLCFMALCFHRHNLTSRNGPNSGNIQLAEHFKGFFYEARTDGTFSIGGRDKKYQMSVGVPGFTLEPEDSPLSRLINALYVLLKMHHDALDWDKMRREWSSNPPRPLTVPTPTALNQRPTSKKVFIGDEPSSEFGLEHTFSSMKISVEESQSSPPAKVSPLATHDAMQNVLRWVSITLSVDVDDKTPDQFSDLPDPDAPIGATLISKDTMSGSFKDASRGSLDVFAKADA